MIRRGRYRRICAATALAGTVLAALPATADEAFLSVMEDLPIMPGLTEDRQAGLVFDSAGGRIVEATASGAVAEGQVLEFYRRALPQLGWSLVGPAEFARSGERLRFAIEDAGGGVIVHYALSPQ